MESVDASVVDDGMSNPAFQQAFPAQDIQKHFVAWEIRSQALEGNSNRDTLKHATSPVTGWRAEVKAL